MSADPVTAAVGRPFEPLETKLRPPRLSDRSVARPRLVERLSRSESPLIIVSAGAGYGKTTALAAWVASLGRPAAWVSIDRDDNDPIVLLTYIAVAISRIAAIEPSVFEALASPGASVEAKVVPRLGAAIARLEDPLTLVLDDVHMLDNPRCIDAIETLVGHLTEGSRLVLSTRDTTSLPMGRLRTRGLSIEFGGDDLRMDDAEAGALLSAAGVHVTERDVADLVRRTEGWPAGLYLAALSGGTSAADTNLSRR